MTIFQFKNASNQKTYTWNLQEGLLYPPGDKPISLDRMSQTGLLLYRFLMYKKLNRFGQTLEDDGLSEIEHARTYVAKIRKMLGEDPKGSFIKTIQGYGYVWVAEVESTQKLAAATLDTPATPDSSKTVPSSNAHFLYERSKQQAFDAGMILRNFSHSQFEDEYLHLNQDLYVHRELETKLIGTLLKPVETPHKLMLMGEAGFGKTSLFWRLYHEFSGNPTWVPVFLSATWLSNVFSGKQGFGFEKFRDAISSLSTGEKRVLVLLDTVDLLLHSQQDKDLLLDVVLELQQRDCHIVISTRPEEALELRGHFPKTFKLELFDDHEMREAVVKHARRLHPESDQGELALKLRKLEEAMNQGRPVYDLCRNPLLLRMLFVLYMPENIPPEIHAYQLYDAYWRRQVQDDIRADQTLNQAAPDCSRAASALALAMVRRGMPTLSKADVFGALRYFNEAEEHITHLQRRGILKGCESDVQFFHQTFFEHAAAKAFLSHGGLEVLTGRIKAESSNYFLQPVLDQAMLTAEGGAEDLLVRRYVQTCLESSGFHMNISGIYLYTHLENDTSASHLATLQLLRRNKEKRDNHSLMVHFLQYSANVRNKRRWERLWKELGVIWRSSDWLLFSHFLEMLERFALRCPEKVFQFLQDGAVFGRVLEKPDSLTVSRSFLTILKHLIPFKADCIFETLMVFFKRMESGSIKSRNIQIDILNLITDMAPYFGEDPCLADRVLTHIKDLPLGLERNKAQYNQALGRLLACQYFRVGLGFRDVFQTIPMPVGKASIPHLNALAIWLASQKKPCEVFWEVFMSLDQACLVWWDVAFFPIILNPSQEFLVSTNPKKISRSQFLLESGQPAQFYCQFLIGVLEEFTQSHLAKEHFPKRLFRILRDGISKANLSDETLADYFDRNAFNHSELWLDVNVLGSLLVPAAVGGHSIAKEVLRCLVENRNGESVSSLGRYACTQLAKRVPLRQDYWRHFLALALYNEEAVLVTEAFKKMDLLPSVLKKDSLLLKSWCKRLARSNSRIKRRQAYLLYYEGVRLSLIPIPSFETLEEVILNDIENKVRYGALSLLGLGLKMGHYEYHQVSAFLENQWFEARTPSLRSRALTMLAFGAAGPAKVPDEQLEIILLRGFSQKPPDVLYYANTLMTKIVEGNKFNALRLLDKIYFQKEGVALLSLGGRKTFSNRLRKALRLLANQLTTEERRNWVNWIPRLTLPDARATLDAVCYRHYHEVGDLLDGFQADEEMAGAIRNVAIHHKKVRRQSEGGDPWPDLFTNFGPGSRN